MKLRLFILSAAAGLGLATAASAVTDNPYAPIVQRNVFNLNPLPTNNPADQKLPDPPSKITPNGIMTIFGKLQVLFKVQEPGKAGQPAKEQSYVMGEGERQDDIEVQKIDEKAAAITFNNHGILQTLELVKGGSSGGAPGGAPPVPGGPAATAAALVKGAPGIPTPPVGFGARFGRGRPAPTTGAGDAGGTGGAASTAASTSKAEVNEKGIYQPSTADDGLTAEQRIILLEAQRQKLIEEGDKSAILLPTTPLTKELQGDTTTK